MIDQSNSNKRIAKNTIFLYIRMLILMVVNLYTSRVVLQVLGVEDFGIYNVVGGIVTMFAFLNATMSGATSRFLTYELGQNNLVRLKETFQVALFLHFVITLILLLLAETIGLWFLNHKLVIPENRMYAANWVYQAAILTMMTKIIQVPYNASIISNERMQVYAYVEIVNAFVIVGGIYLLHLYNGDRLILYAFMLSFFAFAVLVMYVIYCIRNFSECGIKLLCKKSILMPMLSFSGWDLYGNICAIVRFQGLNILLNLFFGPILNAANGIATQVQAGVSSFSTSVITAYRPQIVKKYAIKDMKAMKVLLYDSTKISIILFSVLAIPIILETSYILRIWLVSPPDYSIDIIRITLVTCFVGIVNTILTNAVHATGKIKTLSFVGGTIYLFTLPLVYMVLTIYCVPNSAYWTCFCSTFILILSSLIITKIKLPFISIKSYINKCLFPSVVCVTFSSIITYVCSVFMCESFMRLVFVFLLYMTMISLSSYFLILSNKNKVEIKTYIKRKLNFL